MRNQGRNRGSTFPRLHVMMAELGLSSAGQLKRPVGTCGQDPTVGAGPSGVGQANLNPWGPLPVSAPRADNPAFTQHLAFVLHPCLPLAPPDILLMLL